MYGGAFVFLHHSAPSCITFRPDRALIARVLTRTGAVSSNEGLFQ